MKIAEIINNSTAEVKDYFADVIFFQGCYFKCPYCFNKEIRDFNKGTEMNIPEILSNLSGMSDIVVLTGGDPLHQEKYEIINLIDTLQSYGKRVIIETATFIDYIFDIADKVYGSINCYEPLKNYGVLSQLDLYDNVELVVVVGYTGFNLQYFRDLIANTEKDVWIKHYTGASVSDYLVDTVKAVLKKYNKPYKILEKLIL